MQVHALGLKSLFGFAALVVVAAPAWAGVPAAPGPVLGAGLPALAAFGAGYWLIRRRRRG